MALREPQEWFTGLGARKGGWLVSNVACKGDWLARNSARKGMWLIGYRAGRVGMSELMKG
jgi:hypothetical protein